MRVLVQTPPAIDLTAPGAASGGGSQTDVTTRSDAMHGMHGMHGMGGGDAGGSDAGGGKEEFVYDEESADPVFPPVPVEVQGIIYIYNPPKVQNQNETPGGNGGQAAPTPSNAAMPANTAPGTGLPVPAANSNLPGGPAPIAPAAGTQTAPPTIPPAHGGRP